MKSFKRPTCHIISLFGLALINDFLKLLMMWGCEGFLRRFSQADRKVKETRCFTINGERGLKKRNIKEEGEGIAGQGWVIGGGWFVFSR